MAIGNKNLILLKTDRISAWVLLGAILLYFLTGYGMTKGIIDREMASFLHEDILPFITMTAFIIHTFLAIRLVFMRKRFWNKFSQFLLSAVYLITFLFFLYFSLFYKVSKKESKPTVSVPTAQNSSDENSTAEKIYTLEELAKYNGQNGNPAYVAVDGVVYDMGDIFENGIHFGHEAGRELTDAFYLKHVKAQITKYPAVGRLE